MEVSLHAEFDVIVDWRVTFPPWHNADEEIKIFIKGINSVYPCVLPSVISLQTDSGRFIAFINVISSDSTLESFNKGIQLFL